MDWELLVAWSGSGIVWFLNVAGILSLTVPGRLDHDRAGPLGLGRHVEGLLIVAVASALYFAGIGNVPVFIDRNGVVAFSLVGAILPTILSVRFLVRAGWRRALLALAAMVLVALAGYAVSRPQEGVGIIAGYPYFFLPSLVAAAAATLIAPRSIGAVPIAYACGSMGVLIGGDLVRLNWVLTTPKAVGASFGGAEFFDLVFLSGVWAAAMAALPLGSYWARLRRRHPEWETVARTSRDGRFEEALREAVTIVETRLQAWARDQGLADRSPAEVRRRSFAEPVLAQAGAALRLGPALPPDEARTLIERLAGLDRRLRRLVPPEPATTARRAAAALVDLVPVFIVGFLAFELSRGAQPGPRVFFAFSAAVSAHVLVPFVTEWAFQGATLGKAVLRLRVARLDARPPTGWDALVRNLARLIDVPLLYLIAFASPDYAGRQRLGDYFAGTVVVAKANKSTVTASPTPMATPAIQATEGINREPLWPGSRPSNERKPERK